VGRGKTGRGMEIRGLALGDRRLWHPQFWRARTATVVV